MVKRNAIATKLTKRCTQTQKRAFDVADTVEHAINCKDRAIIPCSQCKLLLRAFFTMDILLMPEKWCPCSPLVEAQVWDFNGANYIHMPPLPWYMRRLGVLGSNANYDRWLRDSVISYVTFTFLSFILERMILCDLFWLASLFTKVTSGKSSHFLFKSKPFSHSPKVSFDIWLMWLWL